MTLVPIGTKSQIWDIITSTVLVIWIFSFPKPYFPKPNQNFFPRPNLSETQTFFPKPNFSETKTKTFFWDQIFRNWNWNPQNFGKIFEPRSFETEMSISDTWQSLSASQCISLAKCLTRQEQQEVVAALRTRNRQYFDQAQATTILDQDTDKANIALQEVFTHMFTIALIFGHNDSKWASIQQFFGWWKKHRKNCECCPVSQLIVR